MAPVHSSGLTFAAIAGVCGALGSVFAKFALSGWIHERICQTTTTISVYLGSTYCDYITYFLRAVCLIGTVLTNGIMWQFFTRALVGCSTSVEAKIGSTFSSSCISAIIGWFIFGESFSYLWFIGVVFIVLGLVVIHKTREPESTKKEA